MPAEWEHHSAVWLSWPYDDTTFPGRVHKAEEVFVQMIKALHETEAIELIVLNEAMLERVQSTLESVGVNISKVNFHITDYADVWIRDYGPTFITNNQINELAWIKWHYNAYGKSVDPYFGLVMKDNEVFFNLRKEIDKRMFEPGIVMEGGAIEVNGEGVLLTTEQCLLNKNRNPNLNKAQAERILSDNLGVHKIIWLKEGLFNDHTDGHIDEIARFVAPNKIICAYEEDANDENFQILDTNYQVLKNSTDHEGKPFEVIKLPMPHMNYEAGHSLHSTGPQDPSKKNTETEKASVSYCNFYIGNKVVLAT
ncbi:MAG: agmatine deiminase family protein, partial [bacterium]|nr:agmatine deiminase family protein [bacterium]